MFEKMILMTFAAMLIVIVVYALLPAFSAFCKVLSGETEEKEDLPRGIRSEDLIFVHGDPMTMNAYQKEAMRTDPPHDTNRDGLINAALGMAGESGEVCDLLKKWLFQGHDFDREHMAKEVGDVLWYCAQAAEYLGMPLEQIAQMNIDKLYKRYPEAFDPEKSRNRAEDDV